MSSWFIVAGGPSLRGFNWELLRDRQVVAINRSYEVCPWAKIVYATDRRFIECHATALSQHPGRIITGARGDGVPAFCEKVELTGASGLEPVFGKLRHGNNSGYAAINLLMQLEASKIFLLGYDFAYDTGGRSHWHSGHTGMWHEERVFENMLPYFSGLNSELLERGVMVWNLNFGSRLKEFPFLSLELALEYSASCS